MDRVCAEALKLIADDLARARAEIRALGPEGLRRDSLPAAGAELEAIVRDTETATDAIMSAAEALLAQDGADPADVRARATAIIEACAFQDITGQRIAKVVGVLRQIEARVSRLADAFVLGESERPENAEERRRREQLLHGPSLRPADQSLVDAALAGTATQDDIDALFSR